MTEQPNILFIQVDQLTALALRAYGDRYCHAPSLDALAENGVVFENAYCNFPLCAPSRFSMASGQLCSRIEAYDNASEFSQKFQPMPITCAQPAIRRPCPVKCISSAPTSSMGLKGA